MPPGIPEWVPDMYQSDTSYRHVVTLVGVEMMATIISFFTIQLEQSSVAARASTGPIEPTIRAMPQKICLVVESPEKTA